MKRQPGGWSGTPIKLRTNAPSQTEDYLTDDENEEAWTVEKPHSSAVKYPLPPQRKRTNRLEPAYTRKIKPRRFDRYTLIIIACLLLIVMIGGWWLLSTISNWWMNVQDDWKYGSIRTYQTDQFVGQGDSLSYPDHFIVVNNHGQVIVIQLNPQHPNLDHIYGITTSSDPKTPVSLDFRQSGNTFAMYVIVGDTNPYTVELVSDGKQFVSSH